jgi:hypothetical protein
MPDITLRRHLSEPNLPLNIALRGVVDAGETDIKSVEITYSFDDDPDMKPQVAGTVAPGAALAFPIDLNNRPIRISAVGFTEDGRSHVTDIKEATQVVYTPTAFDKTVKTGLFSLFNFTFTGTTQTTGLGTIVNDGAGNYYNYLMPAGTLAAGDSIFVEFGFNLLNDGNEKIHEAIFFGYGLGQIDTTSQGSGWMKITFQVQDGGTVKYTSVAVVQDAITLMNEVVLMKTDEITGLDFAANDYDWQYIVTDLNAAGDSLVSMGNAFKIPAPADPLVSYLIDDGSGDFLVSDDGTMTLVADED